MEIIHTGWYVGQRSYVISNNIMANVIFQKRVIYANIASYVQNPKRVNVDLHNVPIGIYNTDVLTRDN
ncbi:MAG: hypothetical protein EOO07_30145 [Chitinophagaceae bacterium]|nr:MAG: hypothetical protein EOO07_30145 [Chitinophagaceae bacterium]